MGQRVKIRKNSKSKGVAIRRTSLSTPNNTVTVGNVTLRGGGKNSSRTGGRKVRRRRKRK